jgi:hypothetical protein
MPAAEGLPPAPSPPPPKRAKRGAYMLVHVASRQASWYPTSAVVGA